MATHVDDYVDRHGGDPYARWFFFLHRLPAALKADFDKWIAPHELYCTWKGKRYRVTGASRFGDVWLNPDFSRDCGYTERVNLDDCSEWGARP